MTKYRNLDPGDPLPADFPDALSEFLGAAALNFQLIIKPGAPTTLQVPAGAGNAQASIAINGCWRYNSANVERASPGGSAQTFDVYVTGSDNVFVITGDHEVDNTDYAFGLAIVVTGHTPTAALVRKVGTAVWDGTKFTSVTQTVPPLPSGAATVVALMAETTRAEAAEATLAAGVAADTAFVSRFEVFRHTFNSGALSPGDSQIENVPLPVAFADANYTVQVTAALAVHSVATSLFGNVGAGSFNVEIVMTGAATMPAGTLVTLHVIVIHD